MKTLKRGWKQFRKVINRPKNAYYKYVLVFLLTYSLSIFVTNNYFFDIQFYSYNRNPTTKDLVWQLVVGFYSFVATCFIAFEDIRKQK